MKTPIQYIILLFLACVSLTACIYEFPPVDDGTVDPEENPFADGYSLSFTVTLDALGGEMATRVSLESINNWENYVDPQKFRILFFAGEEKNAEGEWVKVEDGAFLFESRTRFIKELTSADGGSLWRVSVPLFAYGNGAHYGWHWEEIREYLRDHSFKIAVLANRPELEWSMRVLGKGSDNHQDDPNDIIVPGTWYDNSAPHWEAKNTLFACQEADGTIDVTNTDLKRIFDLHHSQYDPIYYGKNFSTAYNNGETGPDGHTNNHIYDFITTEENDRPYLSSTSSWVSWAGYDGAVYENPETYGYGTTWNFSDNIWVEIIDYINYNGSGRNGFEPQEESGLTISTRGGGAVKVTKSKNGFDNNDNAAGTKGQNMLRFSFELPAGTWSISTKVAVNTSSSSWTLFLEDEDEKILSQKNISNTSVEEITLDEVTIDKPTTVSLYAKGRTEFYSIRYSIGDSMNNKDPEGWGYRRSIHPSQNYPIPMYGIQEFQAISKGEEIWDWGSPYALKNKLMLLRSAVRLDLVIPKTLGTVDFLLLWYSNVFARCEPMDVWTSTGELWNENHTSEAQFGCKDGNNLIAYGAISRSSDGSTSSVGQYQRRMSWLYSVWAEKAGWNWNETDKKNDWEPCNDFRNSTKEGFESGQYSYPRIFNPCVQRNTAVYCGTDLYYDDGENYHYVIYTGERNINDPSDLLKLGDTGSGKPTVAYWMVSINNTVYGIPLADYSGNFKYSPITHAEFKDKQPSNTNYGMSATTSDYSQKVLNGENKGYTYEQAVQRWDAGNTPMPMPLIRNHKYVFTLSKDTSTRSGEGAGITVMSENRYSRPTLF